MEFTYELPWNGEKLDSPLAVDTETRASDDLSKVVPQLVLLTACDGKRNVVVPYERAAEFIRLHRADTWVFQNCGFDFWVLHDHCRATGSTDAALSLWDMVESHQWHDTMIMDALLRIATGEGDIKGQDRDVFGKNLGLLSSRYGGIDISKKDPYRLRFAELLDIPDWNQADQGFFRYAVRDVIATLQIHLKQRELAQEQLALYLPTPDTKGRCAVYPDAVTRWGTFTEHIQVKAAIALAKVTHNGLGFSLDKVDALEAQYRDDFKTFAPFLEENYPQLLKRWKKKAGYHVTKKSGTPSIDHKALITVLEDIARQLEIDAPLSTGKKGGTSKSAKAWARHAHREETDSSKKNAVNFLTKWTTAALIAKRLGFFAALHANRLSGRVHARCTILVRTGRVSNSKPNIQQWPRDPKFRAVFVPTPGYKLMAVDYKFIELRTLAAICQQRLGRSHLGDTIRAGRDPHCHTAALVSGSTYEDVLHWSTLSKTDPQRTDPRFQLHSKNRQSAKVVNFGLGGGLGAEKLSAFAKSTYNVPMTVKEADFLRTKISTEVYPELNSRNGYLASTDLWDLARGLGLTPDLVKREILRDLGDIDLGLYCLSKVIGGDPYKADGTLYNEAFQAKLWLTAWRLSRLSPLLSEETKQDVAIQAGSLATREAFFHPIAWVPTGRPRGKVGYTDARNTPFQGLAADGAKLAIWTLVKQGYQVVGFIHDELLIELPEATAETDAREVERIMNESMESVLLTVPSEVDYHLGTCWAKP